MNHSIKSLYAHFTTLLLCLLGTLGSVTSVQAVLTFSNTGGSIQITGSSPKATGSLIIPPTISNLPVTSIGTSAFQSCSGLTNVTMPSSVTSIGDNAFRDCVRLTSVTIPSSVTSIGTYAFAGCTGLTSVTIGSGVTSIGSYAFADCTGLTSLTIPNSVTSIGEWAFASCSRLTSVTIGSGVTSIVNYVFYGSGLTSVTIPNSVTSIGHQSFQNCTGLTSVTIPSSLTSIANLAFGSCTSLTRVYFMGNAPSSPWASAFNDTPSLIYYIEGTSGWGGSFSGRPTATWAMIQGGLVYSGGVDSFTIIGTDPKASGALIIPAAVNGLPVTAIGHSAFYDYSRLTSVIIPPSVTSIGPAAFGGCTGLTNMTIPNSVTSIGNWAFYYCIGLTNIDFMGNAPSVESGVFDSTPVTVHYIQGNAGWSTSFAGRPTATFNPANAPTITVQPLPLTVTERFPASLSVTVTSSTPLSYQWSKDGVKIANATNSTFSLPTAALTDTGVYEVVVWNDAVLLTSQAVQLTVNIPTFGPPNRLVVQVASSFSNPIWTPVVTNTVLFSSVRRFYQMRASVLEATADLKNPIWIPVATNNIAVTQPQKFYRLITQ